MKYRVRHVVIGDGKEVEIPADAKHVNFASSAPYLRWLEPVLESLDTEPGQYQTILDQRRDLPA